MKNRISQTAKSSCFLNSDTACDLFLRAHEDGSKEENDRYYRRSDAYQFVHERSLLNSAAALLAPRAGAGSSSHPLSKRSWKAGGRQRPECSALRVPSPTAAATRPTEFEQSRRWPSRPGDDARPPASAGTTYRDLGVCRYRTGIIAKQIHLGPQENIAKIRAAKSMPRNASTGPALLAYIYPRRDIPETASFGLRGQTFLPAAHPHDADATIRVIRMSVLMARSDQSAVVRAAIDSQIFPSVSSDAG
jgi:hypothetical protein